MLITGMVTCVDFHPGGTCVAAGSTDSTIKAWRIVISCGHNFMRFWQIWDLRNNKLLQHYQAHDDTVSSVSFHASGNFLLSSSIDSTLKVDSLMQFGFGVVSCFGRLWT